VATGTVALRPNDHGVTVLVGLLLCEGSVGLADRFVHRRELTYVNLVSMLFLPGNPRLLHRYERDPEGAPGHCHQSDPLRCRPIARAASIFASRSAMAWRLSPF
jgi:hypothetical protein